MSVGPRALFRRPVVIKISPNVVTIELFSDRFHRHASGCESLHRLVFYLYSEGSLCIRRRTALIVAGIAATLLLAPIFLVPLVLNVDRYRPQVISYLQEKTGKQIEIGRLALTFFPVAIRIDHFGVKNPPIFPAGYVIQVARIDAQLDVGALLHRQVVIKSLVLEQPIINLVSDPDGPWNFENPGTKNTPGTLLFGMVSRVEIKRGRVIASNLLPSDAAGPVFFEARD